MDRAVKLNCSNGMTRKAIGSLRTCSCYHSCIVCEWWLLRDLPFGPRGGSSPAGQKREMKSESAKEDVQASGK